MNKKICSINKGAFEFPLDFFGEISTVNHNFTQFENQFSILSITTNLNTAEEMSQVNGDYMSYMRPLIDMDITSIDILHVETVEKNTATGQEEVIIPVASFTNYNLVLDLGTDCPPIENLYRGSIRFGRKV